MCALLRTCLFVSPDMWTPCTHFFEQRECSHLGYRWGATNSRTRADVRGGPQAA